MHELLQYQLKKIGYDEQGSLTREQTEALIDAINDTYKTADENCKLCEDTLEVSSERMQILYRTFKDNARNKLARSEEKYHKLISNLQPYYFFYTKDSDGRFTSVSESVKEILGYAPDEFIERYSDVFVKAMDIEDPDRPIDQKDIMPSELKLKHKNGSMRYLELREFPILNVEGKIESIEGILRDVSKEVKTRKKISDMLHFDTLTGISNRLHLEILMEKLLFDHYGKEQRFALLFLDLDHFKHINDTLGHDIGDSLLQQIAESVAQSLRENDIFARVGGDEFIIILDDLDSINLTLAIHRIMKLVRKPWTVRNYELRVSASMGIALYPDDGKNSIDLMKNADIAMYQSKKLGRDNFTFFKEEFNVSVHTEMKLIQDMSNALEKKEFLLYFQPKAWLSNNEIVSAEALIRWRHPELGLINPDKFITLAENTGFILKLGRWIIEEACQAITRFNNVNSNKKPKLSINISVRQFQHEPMYQILEKAITDTGIDGSQLLIELTESIMMENKEEMAYKLKQIKSLNVGIALDDFGTGYSTLAYLDKLSIDTLKIDKAFVDAISKDGTQNTLLDTIIAMGKTLNMLVIAEGVEHEYQREYLLKKGCDIYQGYLFSKPLSEQEYIEYLTK
ncbi:EAL domain-containing protein [Sulfurovum sp.]|uniref:sensor domain-containing protein n=1 Tax=Sulfurovum sp. TaxID=1969726 RepID=UPI0025ECB446|nr:EAL domain-containing protein [Sulfurovum sp.]